MAGEQQNTVESADGSVIEGHLLTSPEDCPEVGETSTLTFEAYFDVEAPTAPGFRGATGPYPGFFHEEGTVTYVNPQPDQDNEFPIVYESTFSIDSPVGRVTGTKSYAINESVDSFAAALCRDEPVRTLGVSTNNIRYDARIETDDYVCFDSGVTAAGLSRSYAELAYPDPFRQFSTYFYPEGSTHTCTAKSADTDSDGVPDLDDNCPDDLNADQRDTDGDGAGDACDELYAFVGGGFSGGPIDNPPIVNTGRAGRAYPLRWQVVDLQGNSVSDLSIIAATSYSTVSCADFSGAESDSIEAEATGGSGLRYDGGAYQLNWKTPSTPGCYRLSVRLVDGQRIYADFSLT